MKCSSALYHYHGNSIAPGIRSPPVRLRHHNPRQPPRFASRGSRPVGDRYPSATRTSPFPARIAAPTSERRFFVMCQCCASKYSKTHPAVGEQPIATRAATGQCRRSLVLPTACATLATPIRETRPKSGVAHQRGQHTPGGIAYSSGPGQPSVPGQRARCRAPAAAAARPVMTAPVPRQLTGSLVRWSPL